MLIFRQYVDGIININMYVELVKANVKLSIDKYKVTIWP